MALNYRIMFLLKIIYFLVNLGFWLILAMIFSEFTPIFFGAVGGSIMFCLCFFYFYKFFLKTDALTFYSTDWEFFKKKLKWSNSLAFTTAVIFFFTTAWLNTL